MSAMNILVPLSSRGLLAWEFRASRASKTFDLGVENARNRINYFNRDNGVIGASSALETVENSDNDARRGRLKLQEV